MTFALVRVRVGREDHAGREVHLGLEEFAARVGLHPDHVRRLVVLGLLDADADPSGRLHFAPGQVARAARIQRLRAGFCLNYAGIGVVLDLLDRIDQLEAAERAAGLRPPRRPPQPRTSVGSARRAVTTVVGDLGPNHAAGPADTVGPVGPVGPADTADTAGPADPARSSRRGHQRAARRNGGYWWIRID